MLQFLLYDMIYYRKSGRLGPLLDRLGFEQVQKLDGMIEVNHLP